MSVNLYDIGRSGLGSKVNLLSTDVLTLSFFSLSREEISDKSPRSRDTHGKSSINPAATFNLTQSDESD